MNSELLTAEKPKLLTGKQKEIEQQIVKFFLDVGNKYNRNMKMTEFYAYFRIYNSLTQKQLKLLTGYSTSTISTTIQAMIQRKLLTRKFLPNTHTNLYSITLDHSSFTYVNNLDFVQKLRSYDDFIADIQQRSEHLTGKYPKQLKLFHSRLSGIRNYIEAHCRALTGQKAVNFFDESFIGLATDESYTDYPPEIRQIEDEFVYHFTTTQMFVLDDPIINKILSYLTTRLKLNQELMQKLTGYSRGTISQVLSQYGKRGYLSVSQKEYRKPRIYSIESMSVYLVSIVLNNYTAILSNLEAFDNLFQKIDREKMEGLLAKAVERIIIDRSDLEKRVHRLTQSKKDLTAFLGK